MRAIGRQAGRQTGRWAERILNTGREGEEKRDVSGMENLKKYRKKRSRGSSCRQRATVFDTPARKVRLKAQANSCAWPRCLYPYQRSLKPVGEYPLTWGTGPLQHSGYSSQLPEVSSGSNSLNIPKGRLKGWMRWASTVQAGTKTQGSRFIKDANHGMSETQERTTCIKYLLLPFSIIFYIL